MSPRFPQIDYRASVVGPVSLATNVSLRPISPATLAYSRAVPAIAASKDGSAAQPWNYRRYNLRSCPRGLRVERNGDALRSVSQPFRIERCICFYVAEVRWGIFVASPPLAGQSYFANDLDMSDGMDSWDSSGCLVGTEALAIACFGFADPR